MKTEKAREIIIATLKEKTTVTAQEINYESKGSLAFVQIYLVLSGLIKNGSVQLNISGDDGKKSYTLIDERKLNDIVIPIEKTKPEKSNKVIEKEDDETEEPMKKSGRDLSTYKFNGADYNKGRLAHSIVAFYVLENKPSLKALIELFPATLIPPYGMIETIQKAKEISKERPRFFIKPEEEIKLRDCSIAVSNQWTAERIEKLIAIARKQLGYKIK